MDIGEFNGMSRGDAMDVLRPCVDIDRWVAAVADERPYRDAADALATARSAANPWTAPEINQALTHHPPIGNRATGENAEAELSRSEQASLGGPDAEADAKLAAGNAHYEEKFGHVFLIRAAGRTKHDILDCLQQRLHNDAETEWGVLAGQLREIAVTRLEGVLT